LRFSEENAGSTFGARLASVWWINVIPTLKYDGGSVTVWGCFAGDKVGDLVRIKGIRDKTRYHNILQCHAFPYEKRLVGRGFIFQQDNDPKHTSKLCKKYIASKEKQKDLKYMDCLPPPPVTWSKLDRTTVGWVGQECAKNATN